MKNLNLVSFALLFLFSVSISYGQDKKEQKPSLSSALGGFKFRSIGPAFMSGRIADIAIDPKNENTWYVAVGSGGVWKTNNAGTTWSALTENMPFYSTGCITIDPNNNASIWLGTGENVGGRHVGIGHGIYHSSDGGKSWKNKGLKNLSISLKLLFTQQMPILFGLLPKVPFGALVGKEECTKAMTVERPGKTPLK